MTLREAAEAIRDHDRCMIAKGILRHFVELERLEIAIAADKARGTPEPFMWGIDFGDKGIPCFVCWCQADAEDAARHKYAPIKGTAFPLYRHPPAADGEQGESAGDAITTLRAIRDRHLKFVPRPTESGAPGVGWYDDPENWRPKQDAGKYLDLLEEVARCAKDWSEDCADYRKQDFVSFALEALRAHRAGKAKGGG